MAKKKRDRSPLPPRPANNREHKAADSAPAPTPGTRAQAITRELVEMIVTAFVLAFLFRTFEAEAFVIPTGSMATTLMGRHKDVRCEMCGYPYQVSASEEVTSDTGAATGDWVVGGVCSMCGYKMPMRRNEHASFNGDRILVNKFAYQFSDPERFDVAVFHCPDEARINYVKRITGLPGETIQIQNGDLFVKKDGQSEFEIARKPPGKFLAMLRTVSDNDYVLPKALLNHGWPARWQVVDPAGGWTTSEDLTSFSTDGSGSGEKWLRYRHFVPIPVIWGYLEQYGALPQGYPPRSQLIADDCAYNSNLVTSGKNPPQGGLGLHWVGDLAVACTLKVRGESGAVVFELVEGVRTMQCRLDVATGQATFSISGPEGFTWTGPTQARGPGEYKILFANVDDELRLSVDGRWIVFDKPTAHPPLGNNSPTEADLSPVGIASLGADVEIQHLRVLRDTYYIATDRQSGHVSDFVDPLGLYPNYSPQQIARVMSSPARYAQAERRPVEFTLKQDQFLALGDNSARSKDSRLWDNGYYVDRELLIGQALFIYWPHSWDRIALGEWKIPFPFFPNFAKMGFVR